MDNIFNHLLHVTLQETTSVAVQHGAPKLLVHVIPLALASPTAEVVATLAKEFVKAYFDHSAQLEKKIDKLLDSKFRTGTRKLLTCLEEKPTTPEEKEFWSGELEQAKKLLDEAFEQTDVEERKQLIRVLQAVATALIPGAAYLCKKYVNEFENQSFRMKRLSEAFQKQADDMGEYIYGGFVGMLENQQRLFEARGAHAHYSQKNSLVTASKELKARAEEIDIYIQLVKEIQQHGPAVFQDK